MAHITRMAITINNPTDDDYQQMHDICKIARYAVAADEVGACGTPHIQAYVALKQEKKQRQSGWKKLLPCAHFTFNIRTEKYASDYCKKGEQSKDEWDALEEKGPNWGLNLRLIFEHGELDHRGLDGRTATLAKAIVAGTISAKQIAKEYPESYVHHARGFHELQSVQNERLFRSWPTTGEWVYGDTGVGKSYVWESNYDPKTMFVIKPEDKGWTDGYDGQPIVIIDELRKGHISYAMILKMLDAGPYWLTNRGRSPVPFLAKHIYITSCYHPRDLYDGEDSIDQLLDRLSGNITHYDYVHHTELKAPCMFEPAMLAECAFAVVDPLRDNRSREHARVEHGHLRSMAR